MEYDSLFLMKVFQEYKLELIQSIDLVNPD